MRTKQATPTRTQHAAVLCKPRQIQYICQYAFIFPAIMPALPHPDALPQILLQDDPALFQALLDNELGGIYLIQDNRFGKYPPAKPGALVC